MVLSPPSHRATRLRPPAAAVKRAATPLPSRLGRDPRAARPGADKLILALALSSAAASKYDRSVEMNVRDTAVSSIEDANLSGEVETRARRPSPF